MLSILSSPPLGANTYKQTDSDSHTHTKPFSSITAISSNQWKVLQREMNLISLFIFLLQRLMYFCFLSYGSFLERMRRQERQTRGMINYRHRHFLCQQYRPLFITARVFGFAFLCLYFLPLWSIKENRVGNGEAFMCSV